MTVQELLTALTRISQTLPNARVRVQAWNDSGDLQDIHLRGDVRLERSALGEPEVVLR
jgi:hypothetical protein